MRKVRTKRAVAAVLALMLMMGLMSGCGKQTNGGDSGSASSGYVYVPSYTKLDEQVQDMSNLSCVGDTIYFSSYIPVHSDGTRVTDEELDEMNAYYESLYSDDYARDTDSDIPAEETSAEEPMDFDVNYVYRLFSVKMDGTGFTELVDYVSPTAPEGDYSYANLNKICADGQGNIWVSESINQTIFDLPDGFDMNTQDPWEYYVEDKTENIIRKLSATGAEIGKLDLTPYIEAPDGEDAMYYRFYVSDMATDSEGNLYISDGNSSIFVANNNCEYQFKLSVDGWVDSFISTKGGIVGIATNNGNGERVLKSIDAASKSWGAEYKISDSIWRTSSGGNMYDFCYSESSSLWGYDLETETSTKILNWLNCDIDGDNIEYSTLLDDGTVFAVTRDWRSDDGPNYEIVTLVKTPANEVKQKTTITMATMYLDYNVKNEILKFNKSNPDYRIEVQDYSEYNTEEDWTAGITKFNTEIISGHVPDIIDVSQLPGEQYAAKGLLEDLYPYIDSDPDFDRSDFVQSIIKAAETDGKLYQLASGFSVVSIIASPDVAGTEMGWTMEEMQAILQEHPDADLPFGMYMSRGNILQSFLMLNMEEYMDWNTGECSFNSDGFKRLLEFAKTFPSDEELESSTNYEDWVEPAVLIGEGRQLFQFFSASDFDSFQYYKATFGGRVTFKGMPSADRNGNIASFNGGMAMTTSCKNKDGAWQFLRRLISDEMQEDQWYFPIMQKQFDEKLAEAMKQEYTTDAEGNRVPVSHGSMSYGNGEVIEFYAITQEEADQFLAMIDSVTKCASLDNSLADIITEEAEYFFAGEKTVDQTADIIQSRMSIYINEQR